jgi:pimeloyl-ACP methyl ester carboxylesterase
MIGADGGSELPPIQEKGVGVMERLSVNGVELEFEAQGAGEPVLLLHGGIIATAFAPLLAQPALTGRYRLINFHRPGYAGSAHPGTPVSIAGQAADATRTVERLPCNSHSMPRMWSSPSPCWNPDC